jgi:putative endonuclease
MEFTVYILFSESCKKFYTGQTHDFENRIVEHNNGETSSIKSCAPWKMVWIKKVGTRSEAVELERKIKSRGAARFFSDLGIVVNH